MLVRVYKGKGDPKKCGNYRSNKLLEHGMKVVERVFESRLRKVATEVRDTDTLLPITAIGRPMVMCCSSIALRICRGASLSLAAASAPSQAEPKGDSSDCNSDLSDNGDRNDADDVYGMPCAAHTAYAGNSR